MVAGMLMRGQTIKRGAIALLFDRSTGALKKEVFEFLLKMEIERATRYRFSFSLAVIEMDMGKGGNGETKEERADIKTLGNLMRVELRKTDILGWGRDGAFCWILPEADEQGARVAGERIRKAVEQFGFKGRRRTISAGIACFPTHSLELPDMLQKAKDQLARAQARGGNQICIPDGASLRGNQFPPP